MVPQILLGMLAAALVPAGVPAGRYPSVASRAHGVRCVSLPVDIRSTGPNSRRISSAIDVNASQEDVWAIITDYDRISEYTPNVLRSRVVPSASAGIRVYQEGAQNIAGFEFRASLTMEMKEVLTDALRRPLPAPRLTFRCAPFPSVEPMARPAGRGMPTVPPLEPRSVPPLRPSRPIDPSSLSRSRTHSTHPRAVHPAGACSPRCFQSTRGSSASSSTARAPGSALASTLRRAARYQ